VDTARDLAGVDPWRESLERSLARRERAKRASSVAASAPRRTRPSRPRPSRPRPSFARPSFPRPSFPRPSLPRPDEDTWGNLWAALQVWGERALSRLPTLGPRGVAAVALLAAIVASSLAHGSQGSPSSAKADAARTAFVTRHSGANANASASAAAVSQRARCTPTVAPAGYVNPLAGATVKRERIDQGVDYAGAGTLEAIGPGRITYLGTTNTGWPGAFIEFQLLRGADAGCYVYYAEGVIPADGLNVGDTVAAGQPIATIIPKYPTGIELGWGSGRGTKAYAKVAGQWTATDDADNVASAAGKSFSDLIAALGGPAGKVEG
jgi:hypothetical protein